MHKTFSIYDIYHNNILLLSYRARSVVLMSVIVVGLRNIFSIQNKTANVLKPPRIINACTHSNYELELDPYARVAVSFGMRDCKRYNTIRGINNIIENAQWTG